MKILIIRQTTNYAFPQLGYGVGIIATILDQAGFEVKVIDNNSQYKHYSNSDLVNYIRIFKPDVLAFNITMLNVLETYDLVSVVKTEFPDLLMISGGIHMKGGFEEALRNGIDIVVVREGEKVIVPLIEYLKDRNRSDFRENLASIPGISYLKENGDLYTSNDFPQVDNLDSVPIVDYDLFNINDYIKTGKEPGIFFLTGQRGCPYKCTFCSDEYQQNDSRAASAEWMFNNVKYLHEKYNARYIVLADNNFTYPRKRTADFCEMLIESGLNKKITFSCQTKIDTSLDNKLLALMKEAGFKRIYVGLERLDEYSMEMIRKKSSIDRVHKVLSSIKSANIEIGIFILIGFPFETVSILSKEWDAFTSLSKHTQNFFCSILQPVPGTIYYEDYPKVKEWYLDRRALNLSRAYFANVLEMYMLGQAERNFFDLPEETQKKIRQFYLGIKKMNYGNFIPNKTIIHSAILKLDLLIAKSSQLLFFFSPTLEFFIFNKVRSMRYFFATLIFGNKVSNQ